MGMDGQGSGSSTGFDFARVGWCFEPRAAGQPEPKLRGGLPDLLLPLPCPGRPPTSIAPFLSSLPLTFERMITTTKQNAANPPHFSSKTRPGDGLTDLGDNSRESDRCSRGFLRVLSGMVGCRQLLPITAATLAIGAEQVGQWGPKTCWPLRISDLELLCRPAIPSSPGHTRPSPIPPISLGSQFALTGLSLAPHLAGSHPQTLHVNEPVSPNARLSTCPMQRGQAKSQAQEHSPPFPTLWARHGTDTRTVPKLSAANSTAGAVPHVCPPREWPPGAHNGRWPWSASHRPTFLLGQPASRTVDR